MFDESVSGVGFVASLGGVQSSITGKVVSEDINVFETTPVFGDGKCVDVESGARAAVFLGAMTSGEQIGELLDIYMYAARRRLSNPRSNLSSCFINLLA